MKKPSIWMRSKKWGHDGSFVTTDYTLDNFEDIYSPKVGSRNAQGSEYFKESIDKETERLLRKYDSMGSKPDDDLIKKIDALL